MSKGRKIIPTTLKTIRGTGRPCRANMDEAKYEALTKVAVPKVLTNARAKHIFRDKSKQLIAHGILQVPDIDLLTAYANTYDLYLQAIEEQSAEGMKLTIEVSTKAGKVTMISPFIKIQQQLLPMLNTLSGAFGFSPSARASLKLQPKEKKDDFEKFMNG
jgi:P27 family predicted phage terminase small subunit